MTDKGKGRRRGPLSDKSEVLTTRITVETRRALEAHAEQAGRSISQEAELLLVRGLQGSDGSLHHLEAVLDTVLTVGRRLSQAERGAGTQDSAFVYFGIIKALEWAQEVLPVPVGDQRFREVAELDTEIARIKRERGDQAGVRRLDARTDAEREADIPADDIEALDRELVALLERRQAALSAIHATRQGADQSTRNVIDEITP